VVDEATQDGGRVRTAARNAPARTSACVSTSRPRSSMARPPTAILGNAPSSKPARLRPPTTLRRPLHIADDQGAPSLIPSWPT